MAEPHDNEHVALLRQPTSNPKLQRLLREQRRLLRDIERRRTAQTQIEALSSELMPELMRRFAPLRERLAATAADVRSLFAFLVGVDSSLTRRHRNHLREIYALLMEEYDLPSLSDKVNLRQSRGNSAGADGRQPVEGFDEDSRQTRRAGAGQPGPSARERDAGPSAPRHCADSSRALRDSFRRLAVALHPDKVQDEGERVARTDLMKAVTQAYERGDVARLFELERSWLAELPAVDVDETLASRVAKQLQVNSELRAQLREATESLKRLRASLPFSIDLGSHHAGRARAREQMDALLAQAQQEVDTLAEIRDRVRDYVQGRTDLVTFLATLPRIQAR